MPDWPAIVTEFTPLAWRVAYRLVGQYADAADCVQQAFAGLVRLHRREGVRDWPAAVTRLATARALDSLRARTRSRVPELVTDPPGRAADPLALAEAGELADALRVALTEIDPLQAEAFCLTALGGLTNQEAAASLGRTANYVGVLAFRARAELREKLRAFDPAKGGTS
jgi:RNA polymerase sigma-70 factor (ECF subfamily)